jgi:hypothetical protein
VRRGGLSLSILDIVRDSLEERAELLSSIAPNLSDINRRANLTRGAEFGKLSNGQPRNLVGGLGLSFLFLSSAPGHALRGCSVTSFSRGG